MCIRDRYMDLPHSAIPNDIFHLLRRIREFQTAKSSDEYEMIRTTFDNATYFKMGMQRDDVQHQLERLSDDWAMSYQAGGPTFMHAWYYAALRKMPTQAAAPCMHSFL